MDWIVGLWGLSSFSFESSDQLSGACSTQKLVEIHNICALVCGTLHKEPYFRNAKATRNTLNPLLIF